jgi:hypothetical protein
LCLDRRTQSVVDPEAQGALDETENLELRSTGV